MYSSAIDELVTDSLSILGDFQDQAQKGNDEFDLALATAPPEAGGQIRDLPFSQILYVWLVGLVVCLVGCFYSVSRYQFLYVTSSFPQ